MRAVIMNAPGEVVVEQRPLPVIQKPTDAVIKLAASCICGSDLWPYRGIRPVDHEAMGHEYVGEVVEVGAAVTSVKPGDFVVGSFCASCGECEICQAGYPSRCQRAIEAGEAYVRGAQAEYLRVPFADGTLVATPSKPDPELIPDLLAASDVLGTGWFAADAAGAAVGKTIAVVGDGAVGLGAVIGASQLGAKRVIAMSRHEARAKLAREFGATDVVAERGEEGATKVKELTGGYGAHGTAEAVGTEQAMQQALASTRYGGYVGFVGVPHGGTISVDQLFGKEVHLFGGPAPVRRYLPQLIKLIFEHKIHPGKVFDLVLPIEQAAEGYAAMDQRRATKVMLTF